MFLFTISLLSSKPVLAVKIRHGFFSSIFKMRSQSRLLVCTTAQQNKHNGINADFVKMNKTHCKKTNSFHIT